MRCYRCGAVNLRPHRAPGRQSSTAQGFADGVKFRLDPQKQTDNAQGLYVISIDSGHTVYLVNPARQEFARVDSETLMAKALEKLKRS